MPVVWRAAPLAGHTAATTTEPEDDGRRSMAGHKRALSVSSGCRQESAATTTAERPFGEHEAPG